MRKWPSFEKNRLYVFGEGFFPRNFFIMIAWLLVKDLRWFIKFKCRESNPGSSTLSSPSSIHSHPQLAPTASLQPSAAFLFKLSHASYFLRQLFFSMRHAIKRSDDQREMFGAN
jgi:hypothetical protein